MRISDWSSDVCSSDLLWTIPAARMKAAREHVIPLSAPALVILERCRELRIGSRALVFPGAKGDAPMSDMTLTKLLREMKEDVTVHGFRSAFRDWVSEETNHPGEIAEAALAHRVKDKTEIGKGSGRERGSVRVKIG